MKFKYKYRIVKLAKPYYINTHAYRLGNFCNYRVDVKMLFFWVTDRYCKDEEEAYNTIDKIKSRNKNISHNKIVALLFIIS